MLEKQWGFQTELGSWCVGTAGLTKWLLDLQYLASQGNTELHTSATATTATLARRNWGAVDSLNMPLFNPRLCCKRTESYQGIYIRPIVWESLCAQCFRDRWQEIWFDLLDETAVHEMMCSRNAYCSLNCMVLPALVFTLFTMLIAGIVFVFFVTGGDKTVG